MFGMLDYRAHKLFWIIFFIPNLILTLFTLFGLPLINYSIGLALADIRIFQIIISLISMFLLELIWSLIGLGVVKLFNFMFSLLVDVIPDDERTKEEAWLVATGGDRAIRMLAIDKHPETWTDELIEEMPKNDWVMNIFYKQKTTKRLRVIMDHYYSNKGDLVHEDVINEIIEKNNLKPGWFELTVVDRTKRKMILGYSFFLMLLLFNPFG